MNQKYFWVDTLLTHIFRITLMQKDEEIFEKKTFYGPQIRDMSFRGEKIHIGAESPRWWTIFFLFHPTKKLDVALKNSHKK